MVIRTIRIAATALFMGATITPALGQFHSPSCAVPADPTCAVPAVPCDPNCAAPSNCSGCGQQTGSCYHPQSVCCPPQSKGLFGCGLRPLFSWTKIEVENKEKCCESKSQCCQPQMAAVPTMAFQPVQLQMTAYQPVMMQAVAPAAVFQPAAFAPQAIQPVSMMAAPQQFVQPVSVMSAPQQLVQPVSVASVAPQQVAALRPAATPECNLEQVCKDLEELKTRVAELSRKVENSSANGTTSDAVTERLSKAEQAIERLNEASNLQTDVLKELKKHLEQK